MSLYDDEDSNKNDCSSCSCKYCTQRENCAMNYCELCEGNSEAHYDCLDYKDH